MFVHDDRQYKKQAEVNLISIEFHNIVNGILANGKYRGTASEKDVVGADSTPINTIRGILKDQFKVSLSSSWGLDSMPTKGLQKLAQAQDFINVNTVLDMADDTGRMSGNHSEAYKAGPFSSQKYKGVGNGFNYKLSFTAYADAEEMLGFEMDEGCRLSSPLEAFYWLCINQLPKEGRGFASNIWNQATGTAKGLLTGIAQWIKDEKQKDEAFYETLDHGLGTLNANPGNWISRIAIGNYLAGWFVVKSFEASFSKQRYYDNTPLYIDFNLDIENYMIPDKANLIGSKAEIVSYKGAAVKDVSPFANIYIENKQDPGMKQKLQAGAKGVKEEEKK